MQQDGRTLYQMPRLALQGGSGSVACIAACKRNERFQSQKRHIRGPLQRELAQLPWGTAHNVPGVLDCGHPREYVSTSWKLRTRMLIGFFGLTSLTAASIWTESAFARLQTSAGYESVGMMPICRDGTTLSSLQLEPPAA